MLTIDRRGFLGSIMLALVPGLRRRMGGAAAGATPTALPGPGPAPRRAHFLIKRESTYGVTLSPPLGTQPVMLRRKDIERFREAADRNYRNLVPLQEWVRGRQ